MKWLYKWGVRSLDTLLRREKLVHFKVDELGLLLTPDSSLAGLRAGAAIAKIVREAGWFAEEPDANDAVRLPRGRQWHGPMFHAICKTMSVLPATLPMEMFLGVCRAAHKVQTDEEEANYYPYRGED